MPWNDGVATFKAGEALAAKRRVKIESGTTNDPPEVVYADAGEDFIGVTEYDVADGDMVAVKLNNAPGIFEIECVVDSAIARGTVLYGAADGKVSDASSGTAQGISVEVGADNQHIQVALWNVKATTAWPRSTRIFCRHSASSHYLSPNGAKSAATTSRTWPRTAGPWPKTPRRFWNTPTETPTARCA